jgi:hypothetical protein
MTVRRLHIGIAALAGVSAAYLVGAELPPACMRTIPDETGGARRDAA